MIPDSTPPSKDRIKKRRWFVILFLWWIAAVFVYLLLAAKENRAMDAVIAAGIQTTRQSAENAGLPLLERDVQALTRMVQSVAGAPGIVNVSIVDHRDKIIAFTDMASIFPMPASTKHHTGGVDFWPFTLSDGRPAICFSAPIEYAGTRIGEVLVAGTAGDAGGWRAWFGSIAAGCLLVIVFVLLVSDFHGIRPIRAAVRQRFEKWAGAPDELPAEKELVCPLCGQRKPLTRRFLLDVNLDRYPVLRAPEADHRSAQLLNATGISLLDIARRSDLGWFRLQVIHRCADIIKRLAGN